MPRASRIRESKACRACAHAKVKCEPQQSADACKRCARLGKKCTMQIPGAHRRTTPTDVTRLEQKLDHVVATLAASPQVLETAAGVGSGGQTLAPADAVPSSDPQVFSDEELTKLLAVFQAEMAPYSPVVFIPGDTEVVQMREKTPFLLSVIVMVACLEDLARRRILADKVREDIAKIVVNGERSLDLLQGLLVYFTWYHYQLDEGPRASGILHLALGMLVELGLHKPEHSPTIETPDAGEQRGRTLEERRVYLGCFYISSIGAMFLDDIAPMTYTNYTEESCRSIERADAPEGDLDLAYLVRLHGMAGKLRRGLTPDHHPKPPLSEFIHSLKHAMEEVRPPQVSNAVSQSLLILHFHAVQMWLYEFALEDTLVDFYKDISDRHVPLYACLSAATAFLDTFASIAPRNYINIPYPVFAAHLHALRLLSQLVLFRDRFWNMQQLTTLPDTVRKFVGNIDKAIRIYWWPQPQVSKTLRRFIPPVRALEEAHERKLAALTNQTVNGASNTEDSRAGGDQRDTMYQLPHDLSWSFLRKG